MRMTGKHPHMKFRISGQQTLVIIISGTELCNKLIKKDTTSQGIICSQRYFHGVRLEFSFILQMEALLCHHWDDNM